MAILPPLLRIPRELRLQIFHIVADEDVKALSHVFLNRTLYEEALSVFYMHWVPTVTVYTDTYVAYYKRPETPKESEVMPHGLEERLLMRSNSQPNSAIEPEHYPPEQYGPDSLEKLRDTLAWLNEMPDPARKSVRRIRIPGVQTRMVKYKTLIQSEQPKKGTFYSLERSMDQLSETQAIEETELREKIWTFCRQELKNFDGFEYVYEVSALSPWAQQLELEIVLGLTISGVMAPRCMRLIFNCPLESAVYFLSSSRRHEFLQIFATWRRRKEASQAGELRPGLEEVDFWTSYDIKDSHSFTDKNDIDGVWKRFVNLRQDILAVGFGNTMATKSFQLFRNGRVKEINETDFSRGAPEWWSNKDPNEVRIST